MRKLTDFDYDIQQDSIAQQPKIKRDESRLLIFNKKQGSIEHKRFYQIVDYLQKGDLLVFNDAKVLPARLIGRKKSGGFVEILLLNEIVPYKWNILIKSSSKPKPGHQVQFSQSALFGTILAAPANGQCPMSFNYGSGQFKTEHEFWDIVNRIGRPPLPPYIKRKKCEDKHDIRDKERYQTVFAKKTGAIAAPTAGLHFTVELLKKIRNKGVKMAYVTLHVGMGTFKPIKVDDYRNHVMDPEYYKVSKQAANSIKRAKEEGRRIIAVGTTSCRVLEATSNNGSIKPCSGWTSLFIFPPYKFKTTNALITNFHQPKTTLLLLVSALAGRESILQTYETAKNSGYKFYSYGDSMMIV